MTDLPGPIDHIVAVVPARNESATIEACIESLHRARAALPPNITSAIVIAADCCSDDTVERALRTVDRGCDLVVTCAAGAAGAARRIGTELALRQTPSPLRRTWLAATDADSTVASDWFTTHIEAAGRGFVGVAGVVRLAADTEPAVVREFDRTYVINMDGSHPHVHGTNLGIRADAYVAAGGWADLATAEDHELWNRVGTVGPRLSSTQLIVTTSGRIVGRAPDGFATTLARLVADTESAA